MMSSDTNGSCLRLLLTRKDNPPGHGQPKAFGTPAVPRSFEELGLVLEDDRNSSSDWDCTVMGTAGGFHQGGNPLSAMPCLRPAAVDTAWVQSAAENCMPNLNSQPTPAAYQNTSHDRPPVEMPRLLANDADPLGFVPTAVGANRVPVPGRQSDGWPTAGLEQGNVRRMVVIANPTSKLVVAQNGVVPTDWNLVGSVVREVKVPRSEPGMGPQLFNERQLPYFTNSASMGHRPQFLPTAVPGFVGDVATGAVNARSGPMFMSSAPHLRYGFPSNRFHHGVSVAGRGGTMRRVVYDPSIGRLVRLDNNCQNPLGGFTVYNGGGVMASETNGQTSWFSQTNAPPKTSSNLNNTAGARSRAAHGVFRGGEHDTPSPFGHFLLGQMRRRYSDGSGGKESDEEGQGEPMDTSMESMYQPEGDAVPIRRRQRGRNVVGRGQRPARQPRGRGVRAARQYQAWKEAGNTVLEGETEEIVVEVDLPFLFSDDDDEEDEVSEVVSGVEDPLAPTEEDIAAVDSMRREEQSSWSPFLSGRRGILVLKDRVRGGQRGGRRTSGVGRKKAVASSASDCTPDKNGSLPPRLKDCFVRLERCDDPGGVLHRLRAGERLDGCTPQTTEKAGTSNSAKLDSEMSGSGSAAEPPHVQRQKSGPKKDYWLQLLDRERREALEALEAVRKRMSEENPSCQLNGVRISMFEEEEEMSPPKTNGAEDISPLLEERRWKLLEEEFRRRDEMRRESVSRNAVSPPQPVTEEERSDRNWSGNEPSQSPSLTASKRLTLCIKESSASSLADTQGSTNAPALQQITNGTPVASGVFRKGRRRNMVSGSVVNDPRIAELQQKARTKKWSGTQVLPKTKECYVRLEKCDQVACRSDDGCSTSDCSAVQSDAPSMHIDSIKMRSVTLSASPVTHGDSVSQTSLVCLQGEVGLSRRRDHGPMVKEGDSSEGGDQEKGSSQANPSSHMVLVEMKKLVVVIKRASVTDKGVRTRRALLAEAVRPNPWRASLRALCDGSETKVEGDTEPVSQVKRCSVRLKRCDQVGTEVNRNVAVPEKKRQRVK